MAHDGVVSFDTDSLQNIKERIDKAADNYMTLLNKMDNEVNNELRAAWGGEESGYNEYLKSYTDKKATFKELTDILEEISSGVNEIKMKSEDLSSNIMSSMKF